MQNRATLYTYIVKIDTGFAPNPFHGFCTLACCRADIRRIAQEGDYVLGIGPKDTENRVVFAMKVKEVLKFDEYWRDKRFRKKRPDILMGGEGAVGDNIYHRDKSGKCRQSPSQHSHESGEQDWESTRKDIRGEKVLIGDDFIYWGGDGPPLPECLRDVIPPGRAFKSRSNDIYIPDFVRWFEGQAERGRLGLPTDQVPSQCTRRKRRRRKRC